MLKVALTGGIGSGKSTVANLFKKLGIPIIDADLIAHDITKTDTKALQSILEHFGKDISKSDGTLDRKKLRELIFQNSEERQWLEQLLHPIIRQTMKDHLKKTKSPYCILVIPLLAESNAIDFIDRVCVIDIPESLQMERAMQRDGASEAAVKAILQSQSSREKRVAIADDIIHNEGDLTQLEEQVKALHERYLSLGEKSDC